MRLGRCRFPNLWCCGDLHLMSSAISGYGVSRFLAHCFARVSFLRLLFGVLSLPVRFADSQSKNPHSGESIQSNYCSPFSMMRGTFEKGAVRRGMRWNQSR